jgi:hypothetical protein
MRSSGNQISCHRSPEKLQPAFVHAIYLDRSVLIANYRPSRGTANAYANPETTIPFVFQFLQLFFSFSAQKTHVKSQINLTHYQTTTSAWHFS